MITKIYPSKTERGVKIVGNKLIFCDGLNNYDVVDIDFSEKKIYTSKNKSSFFHLTETDCDVCKKHYDEYIEQYI